jgi:Winged helix DNA-binding domain
MRLIDDAERRARLARRHAFAPQHRLADVVAAASAVIGLHATEPATPYLSLFARIDSFTRADLEEALLASRSLVKQLAMRRTLFVFPRDLLPAALGAPSARPPSSTGPATAAPPHDGTAGLSAPAGRTRRGGWS